MEKGRLMMVVIIILLVALLGTVVGVAFFVLNAVADMGLPTITEQQIGRTPPPLRATEITRISAGDVITTNVGDANSMRFARFQVQIGIDNTQGPDTIEAERVIREQVDYIRTIALEYVSRTPIEDLMDSDSRGHVRTSIKEHLIRELRIELIVDVTFNEWLIT
jgi:flagellar basal body-associated protein FliL